MTEHLGFPAHGDFVDAGFGRPEKILVAPGYHDVIVRCYEEVSGDSGVLLQGHNLERLMAEMKDRHGVPVVPFRLFIADAMPIHEPDEYGLYAAVRRVTGKAMVNVDDSTVPKDIPFDAYHNTLRSIADYYATNASRTGAVQFDIHMAQCIYGTTADDPEPKPYMIDLDMNDEWFNPGLPNTDTLEIYYGVLGALAENAVAGQNAFGNRFSDVKDILIEATDTLPDLKNFKDKEYAYMVTEGLERNLRLIKW